MAQDCSGPEWEIYRKATRSKCSKRTNIRSSPWLGVGDSQSAEKAGPTAQHTLKSRSQCERRGREVGALMNLRRTSADIVCNWQNPHPGLASSAWLQFCISNVSSGNSKAFQTASEVRTEGAEAANCLQCGPPPLSYLPVSLRCLLRSQEPL